VVVANTDDIGVGAARPILNIRYYFSDRSLHLYTVLVTKKSIQVHLLKLKNFFDCLSEQSRDGKSERQTGIVFSGFD
jgi:hypothetical protein